MVNQWRSSKIKAMRADLHEENLSDRTQAGRNSVVFRLPCRNPVTLQNADRLFYIIFCGYCVS